MPPLWPTHHHPRALPWRATLAARVKALSRRRLGRLTSPLMPMGILTMPKSERRPLAMLPPPCTGAAAVLVWTRRRRERRSLVPTLEPNLLPVRVTRMIRLERKVKPAMDVQCILPRRTKTILISTTGSQLPLEAQMWKMKTSSALCLCECCGVGARGASRPLTCSNS